MDLEAIISSALSPSFILLSILVSIIAATVIPRILEVRRNIRLYNLIPGPKANPIFGNALEFRVSPKELFQLLTDTFCIRGSSISIFWIGWHPVCMLYKAKSIEVILTSQKQIGKSLDYEFLQPWLGISLLTSAGNMWHQRRKMLTPAFHFKILEDFVDVFNQESKKMVSILQDKANGKPFDISYYIPLCTLDIILETAMGRSINVQENSDSAYVKALLGMSALFQIRQFHPLLHYDFFFKLLGYAKQQNDFLKVLHGFSNEVIKERKNEFQLLKTLKSSEVSEDTEKVKVNSINENSEKRKKPLAFLDLLLSYSEEHRLTDENIRAEVDTFMFEGHDTTAAAINWMIYVLGCYPEIQERVYQELFSIFGESDRPVTTSDLNEMKYLECCIKETLRLFPSVAMIARKLSEDAIIDGYTVPAGTTVFMNIFSLHRDPEHFPNPEVFNPDRFRSENAVGRHPFAYLPFSAGPRNCIGQKFAQMEEKIVLANFFRNFRVESVVKREDLVVLGEVVLRPKNGVVTKLVSRKMQ